MRNRDSSDADFISCLEEEFKRRRLKNPRYSLRAFSKSLNYHAGSLSSILARKRPLTPKAVTKLAMSLDLSQEQIVYYSEQAIYPRLPLDSLELIEDAKSVLTEWLHFQVLDLIQRKDFLVDYAWMARELGTEEKIARKAWERLERLKLVQLVGQKWTDRLSLMRVPVKKNSALPHSIVFPAANSLTLTLSEETLVELLIQMRKFFSRLSSISHAPKEGLKISLHLSTKIEAKDALQKTVKQKH